jgi:uncharacterized membrane protein
MHPPSFYARAVALACHFVLALALPALVGPLGFALVLPLVAFAPGLWRARPRAYAAASLLLVFYAGGGLMEAFAHASRNVPALAFACVAALEFLALILFVRFNSREATAARSPA